jgi:hypothetical protein
MFLAHNQPFLNFDHLVDVNRLLAIKPYVSAFIAKNHHLLKPTKFYGSLFKDGSLGTHDYQDEFNTDPGIIADPKLREVVSELCKSDQFANYIVFEKEEIWFIVSRKELLDMTMQKLKDNNYKTGSGIYIIHQRPNKKDRITLVPFKDMKTIKHYELTK